MIITIDKDKAFNKIKYPFMVKKIKERNEKQIVKKVEIEENSCDEIKTVYENPRDNMLNGGRLRVFLL